MPEALQIRPMRAPHLFDKDPAKALKNRKIMEDHLRQDGFLLVQPKIDGMRILCWDDARSRAWKPWTSRYIQAFVRTHNDAVWGWDCEMLPGHFDFDNPDPEIFRRAMSELRSEDGAEKMTFFLFDTFDPARRHLDYQDRLKAITQDVQDYGTEFLNLPDAQVKFNVKVILCPTLPVYTMEELDAAHLAFVAAGWEGTMVRRWRGGYKYNKATNREGYLVKMKDMEDDEAEIIGFEPRYRNDNEATTSALGYTVRSSHQENLVPEERLGAFKCRLVRNPNVLFSVGVLRGFTLEDRERIWQQRDKYLGAILKFNHQGYGGGYDAPRTPVGFGFRNPVELD